jgi:hypothetical protein
VFGPIGVPELILGIFLIPIVISAVLIWMLFRGQKRMARESGYPSLGAYLRATPQTDKEKRAAIDLALKGIVVCMLGLLFPPALLIGLFPMFYGVRKIVYAALGLGLLDDGAR